jgi:hypothetical protein
MQGRIHRSHATAFLAGMALAAVAAIGGAALVAPATEPAPAQLTAGPSAAGEEATREALLELEHALHVAQRARRISRAARGKARRGLATANALVPQVEAAQEAANDALSGAQAVTAQLDTTRIVEARASGRVTTGSLTQYVQLSGGPQVTVTVPASGFIEVFASVTMGDASDPGVAGDGAVALFEDGALVQLPGQGGNCTGGASPLDDALMSSDPPPTEEYTVATPPSMSFFGCGTLGEAPGPILLERPPGSHTYELRYGDCGCVPTEDAAFSDRILRVAPQL